MNELRRHLLRVGAAMMGTAALPARVRANDDGAIAGAWQGALALPQGGEAAMALAIARVANGALLVRLTIPAMHAFDAPIAEVDALGAGRYRLDPFGTVGHLDGDRLHGRFAYVGVPFELRRVPTLPAWSDTPETPLPEPPPLAWTRSLGAGAWASPVARDGIAYLGDVAGTVHALRMRDGAVVWTHRHEVPIYGDAAVDAAGVTFVDEQSTLVRLDRRTGVPRWRIDLDAAAPPGAPADFTYTHRTPVPVLAGGTLYVGGRDASVRAIDAATGRVLWRSAVGGAVMSGITVAGPLLVAGTFAHDAVIALDRRDGRVVWAAPTAQPVSSAPVVAGAVVLAGCRDFAIHGLDLDSGAPRWLQSYIFSWVESSPALVGTVAYFGSSDLRSVRAVDCATGHTRYTTDVRGLAWGRPAHVGNRLYVGTAGQKDVLVAHRPGLCALDRTTGALLWRREFPMGDAKTAGFVASLCHDGQTVVGAAVDGTVCAVRVAAG